MIDLARLPLYTTDLITIAETLPDREYKQLMLAVLYYTRDDTLPENLPEKLTLSFNLCKTKIDAARKAYGKKCATNAKSGAKGGKAKAANAAKAQLLPLDPPPDAAFKPPSKAEFKKILKTLKDRGEAVRIPAAEEVNSFYSDLSVSDWFFRGERFRTIQELEAMLIFRYNNFSTPPRALFGGIFATIWGDFSGLRDSAGVSKAADAVNEFCECYDSKARVWAVHGRQYPPDTWPDALADFMATYEAQQT